MRDLTHKEFVNLTTVSQVLLGTIFHVLQSQDQMSPELLEDCHKLFKAGLGRAIRAGLLDKYEDFKFEMKDDVLSMGATLYPKGGTDTPGFPMSAVMCCRKHQPNEICEYETPQEGYDEGSDYFGPESEQNDGLDE